MAASNISRIQSDLVLPALGTALSIRAHSTGVNRAPISTLRVISSFGLPMFAFIVVRQEIITED